VFIQQTPQPLLIIIFILVILLALQNHDVFLFISFGLQVLGPFGRKGMLEFSVQNIALFISSWKISSFFPFGGTKHNLLFIILNSMIDVSILCHAWALADVPLLLQTLL